MGPFKMQKTMSLFNAEYKWHRGPASRLMLPYSDTLVCFFRAALKWFAWFVGSARRVNTPAGLHYENEWSILEQTTEQNEYLEWTEIHRKGKINFPEGQWTLFSFCRTSSTMLCLLAVFSLHSRRADLPESNVIVGSALFQLPPLIESECQWPEMSR